MKEKETLLSEDRVKEILGIDDFRRMTKSGAIEFVSMMSQMEPEVALKALEQFPDLARTAVSWASDYKETMVKVLDVNADESKRILASLQATLDQLNSRLGRDDLSSEDLKLIVDGICKIQEMTLRLHEGNQKHGINVLHMGVRALAVLGAVVLVGLGASGRIKVPTIKK